MHVSDFIGRTRGSDEAWKLHRPNHVCLRNKANFLAAISLLLLTLPTPVSTKSIGTMPKERNFNPVQAQRKADKAKAIKKGVLHHLRTIDRAYVLLTYWMKGRLKWSQDGTRSLRSGIPIA